MWHRVRLIQDQMQTIFRFYPRFAFCDIAFGFLALFSNPYRTCRKFLQKIGEKDCYAYGETPLTTYQKITEICEVLPGDTWLELGAGRGKGCFWLAQFIQCQVIGVEFVPQFVSTACFLKKVLRLKNLRFEQKEIEEANFSSATVVYLYGTFFSDEKIARLTRKFEQLPPGAKIITISYPLESAHLQLVKTFAVSYPWGDTEAFCHIRSLA
jgi:hypothetical protein